MTYMFEVSRAAAASSGLLPFTVSVPGAGQHLQVLGPSAGRLVAAAAAVGGQHGLRQSSCPTGDGEDVLLHQPRVLVLH